MDGNKKKDAGLKITQSMIIHRDSDESASKFQEDQAQMKREFNRLKMDMKQHLDLLNLEGSRPPFTPTAFSTERIKYYHKLLEKVSLYERSSSQKYVVEFSKFVDQELFPLYLAKLRAPYQKIVREENYEVPQKLEIDKIKMNYQFGEVMSALFVQIADWCIQLERTQDILQRAELYEALEVQENSNINNMNVLKTNLRYNHKIDQQKIDLIFNKALVFKNQQEAINLMTCYGLQKIQKVLESKHLSLGTAFGFLYSIFVGSAFPWAATIFGLGSKYVIEGIDSLLITLQKGQKEKEIKLLQQNFQEITANLQQKNDKLENTLFSIIQADPENRKILQTEFQSIQSEIICSGQNISQASEKLVVGDRIMKMKESEDGFIELEDDRVILKENTDGFFEVYQPPNKNNSQL